MHRSAPSDSLNHCLFIANNKPRPSIHQADGRLTARSREVSKPRDWDLEFSNRSEIWIAHRQQCCRDACQMSGGCDDYNIQSRGFEASRDLAVRRLTAKWIEGQRRLFKQGISKYVRHLGAVSISDKMSYHKISTVSRQLGTSNYCTASATPQTSQLGAYVSNAFRLVTHVSVSELSHRWMLNQLICLVACCWHMATYRQLDPQEHVSMEFNSDVKLSLKITYLKSSPSNGNIFHFTGPLCGNSPVTGDFPTQRPVTRSFDVFFDLRIE